MSTFSADRPLETTNGARRIAYKVWREVKRPFRPKVRASTSADRSLETISGGRRIAYKVLREVRRPFRKVRAWTKTSKPAASFEHLLTAGSLTFSNAVSQPSRSLKPPAEPGAAEHSGAAQQSKSVALPQSAVETKRPYLTGTGAAVEGFHPHQATVEPAGVPLVQRLVRQSCQHHGPIIEIGTLLGVTTTTMAIAKAPHQKIITVDLYCWNPWGLPPNVHEALAGQVLQYLVRTGHVERIRMDKNEFFRAYDGPSPAMVFLDAVHDYEETKKDIVWAKQVGARIIAGHDYCDEFPGVKEAVDEFGGPAELEGTVWLLK